MKESQLHVTALRQMLALLFLLAGIPFHAQDSQVDSKLVLRQPPKASTRMKLPNFLPHATKLGDIATKLSDALEQAGYTDQGWFVVPAAFSQSTASSPGSIIGFAVVTRLEQIEDNGQTKAGGARWSLDLSAPNVNSFLDAVKLLLKGAPDGRYRLFLLMVSNDPVSQASGASPSPAAWQDFLARGAKAPLLRLMPSTNVNYGAGGGWYCFVYEYQRSAITGETTFVTNGMTAEQHLKASGIWDALSRADNK